MKKLIYLLGIIIFLSSCSKESPLALYDVEVLTTEGGETNFNKIPIEENSVITLTATPKNENYKNYKFIGWTGSVSSTENPINVIVTENMSITANFRLEKIWENELYSKLKPFDARSFVEVFIADAKRHGVDLSNVNLDNIEFEIKKLNAVAYSLASCDPDNVRIAINEDLWKFNNEIFTNELKFAWLVGVVYHELGHDLLSMSHLCAGGHIMTGNHQAPKGECNGREENLYDLRYNSEDSIINWQRAVEDMFIGRGQYYMNCNNSTSGKGNIIIEEQYEIPKFNN